MRTDNLTQRAQDALQYAFEMAESRSHAQVEPLYVLERDGQLDGPDGETLIVGQLGEAASMLSTLVWAAYTSAEPSAAQVESWLRYDEADRQSGPAGPSPTSQPAPASAPNQPGNR